VPCSISARVSAPGLRSISRSCASIDTCSAAGIGTAPILIVYLLANIALPLHVLATNRAAFRPARHVIVPLIGTAVLVYGVWEFVQPSQPPPANVYWAWILAIVAIAVVATAIAYVRRRPALDRAATEGPELVLDADSTR
jgi:amino acid transporter